MPNRGVTVGIFENIDKSAGTIRVAIDSVCRAWECDAESEDSRATPLYFPRVKRAVNPTIYSIVGDDSDGPAPSPAELESKQRVSYRHTC